MNRQKFSASILLVVFYFNFLGTLFASKRTLEGNIFNGIDYLHRYSKVLNNTKEIKSTIKLSDDTRRLEYFFGGGPSQPEMASFKSVNADNLVNTFTGDFSYNIPLLDVGGYPINLFYSGGITMEQEASWVGLGWNINPGAITRNMRGLPDDFDGTDVITKTQHIKNDETYGVSASASGEFFGLGPDLGFNGGLFYNTNKGFGIEAGGNASISLGLSKKARDENTAFTPSVNLGIGLNINSQEGLSIQPSMGLYLKEADKNDKYGLQVGTSYNSRSGISGLNIEGEVGKFNRVTNTSYPGASYSYPLSTSISFAKPSYVPSIRMPLTHSNTSFEFKTGGEIFGLHGSVSIKGYLSKGQIKPNDVTQKKQAVGYLHLENGNDNKAALLDFNRLNDGAYTQTTPLISIPYYTYDIFSISGEGTGGSFRPYRGNVGFVRDPYTRTKTENNSFGFELGSGQLFHGGIEYNYVNTPTTVYKWGSNNDAEGALKFQPSKAEREGVYFKNPAEKAIVSKDYYDAIGGDNIARLSLLNNGSNQPIALPALDIFDNNRKFSKKIALNADNTSKKIRDKRTQVITYLTAEEAERIGFDKKIKIYPLNDFSLIGNCNVAETPVNTISRVTESNDPTDIDSNYRRRNHISEIDVLEQDGKRYIYGIPVYNTVQKEVSFSVANTPALNDNSGIVTYNTGENTSSNTSGKDHFYQAETTPAYAHSFLLTALLSPDYVDVTNNGITDDDLGDAIKFNYSRFGFDGAKWKNYKWRTPFKANVANTAIYNEGLKTDGKDQKASYTYGEREMWYWHSVESKNMIAVFRLGNRSDNKQPSDENGNTSQDDAALKRLDRIDLYSKAAYIKYLTAVQANPSATQPKPIKSVLFEYFDETQKDKQLCIGTPLNADNTQGKLTLRSVCFTYNGNDKLKKNIYRFGYNNNMPYERNANDRWGTYKKSSSNPAVSLSNADLSNADFPYSLQVNTPFNTSITKQVIDNNAAPWALNKVLLPAGAQLNISYETDDYAYVQNKRAAQMFKIAGFASNPTNTPRPYLNEGSQPSDDYKYVFIEVPKMPASSLSTAAQKIAIYRDYLEGITQLAFKIWVRMPKDYQNQSGYEPINVYANVDFGDINNYGITTNNRIWVKVKEVSGSASPMMATAIQFMKDNLPAKAYPSSNVDPSANGAMQVIRSLVGMMTSIGEAFTGIEIKARLNRMCSNVDISRAFVRLNNPDYSKLGGGYRVKQVRISDNWNKMTNSFDSEYGQKYDYTTSITVDGVKKTISSGVATYEPSIGAEENPFKSVLNYDSKLPMGPTQYGFIDMPFGETFFPSPMVGYSKVRVTSIHRSAKTGNSNDKKIKSGVGIQETQYYTSKDFPSFSDFTDFDGSSNVRYTSDPILKFLKIDVEEMVTLSQGFRVVLNDMNGKMRSQASYPENDDINPINYTEYFYRLEKKGDNSFTLKNNVQVAGKDGVITEQEVGKDIEMMVDFREHKTETTSGGVQFNTDGFTIGPFPLVIPIMFKPPMRDVNTYRSVSVLKVINQYGIVDSVLQIDKGSMVSTKNLVYDKETGDVLVSRTQNEFNNPIYNLNYPAHWVYSGMEPAAKNIDVVYTNVLFRNGLLETPAVDQALFESGDEIYVVDNSSVGVSNTNACIGLGDLSVLPISNEYKIWAVDIAKDTRNTNHRFIFIDKNGTPYNAASANIRIVRSGKRNMLSASVGTVTSLNNPVNSVTNKIDITDATKVVKSGATEFKDKWKGEEAFFVDKVEVQSYNQDCVKFEQGFDNDGECFENRNNYLINYYGVLSYHSNNGLNPLVSNRDIFIDLVTETGNIFNTQNNFTSNSTEKLAAGQQSISFSTGYEGCEDNFQTLRQYTIRYADGSSPLFCPTNPSSPIVVYSYTCDSVFSRNQMNPYLHGILGNWRNSKSYVFYGERQENAFNSTNAIASPTNIKTDGVIKDFEPYWKYNQTSAAVIPSSNVNWVWNSQVSQVNRKGLEVENFDALMRYNSGLYGYNDNLPVAVTNNAKYRETGFDSFEDYDYKEASCVDCSEERKKAHRHWNLGDNTHNFITQAESHSGLSSLMVAPNETFSITNAVTSLPQNNNLSVEESRNTPDMRIELQRNVFHDLVVTPSGNGLDGTYYNLGDGDVYQYAGTRIHDKLTLRDFEIAGSNQNFPYFINQNRIVAEWNGILQVEENGTYNFMMNQIDDDAYFEIYTKTGTLLMRIAADWNGNGLSPNAYGSITLSKGSYNIKAHFHEDNGGANFNVLWTKPSGIAGQYDEIPLKNLYTTSDFSNSNSEVYSDIYCEKPGIIKPIANAKIDAFSLIAGQKMVISAWVKEGGKDCMCSSYDKNALELAFGSATPIPFAPAGNIIEGWQRYECVFTVPNGATTASINLKNLSSTQPVYFDDIRIHPFNANMKSFVYDPVTLRLTSELDENNYATFYEYDADGLLVRVKKETKEGIKTIKETRSAIQSKIQTITY